MPILALINFGYFRLRIENRKLLKIMKKGVIVCNHMHYLDCTMIDLATFPRQVIFVSQKRNFKIPIAGLILRLGGCLELGDSFQEIRTFLANAVIKARNGILLGIYPEGNLILHNKTLQPFKKGAFFVAYEAQVPVIPMVIKHREVNGFRRFYRKKPYLTLKVGLPIHPNLALPKGEAIKSMCDRTYSAMMEMMGDEVWMDPSSSIQSAEVEVQNES